MEHVKTMLACQKPDAKLAFKSPHTIESVVVPVVPTASEPDTTEVLAHQ